MRNGTITIASGADADIQESVTPTLPDPTGSVSSVVQDGLSGKSVPLAGAVSVGALERKVFFFNGNAGALDTIIGRLTGIGAPVNAEFEFDDDGNLTMNGTTRDASAGDQEIIDEVMAPKPPAYKRFSQLISQIETAHEKAGRGCVVVFSQSGNGKLSVFTYDPADVDGVDTALGATVSGEASALGNGGAPLAIATVSAGAVAAAKLPGE